MRIDDHASICGQEYGNGYWDHYLSNWHRRGAFYCHDGLSGRPFWSADSHAGTGQFFRSFLIVCIDSDEEGLEKNYPLNFAGIVDG